MYELEISRYFSAAHQLRGYPGDCKNLHGHNYEVSVIVGAAQLDDIGIAIDFKVFKTALDDVIKGYDHHNLSDLPEFQTINPTSENLARSIYQQMAEKLNNGQIKVLKVQIGESANSRVTYYE